jgi:EAL domain-containing protein (putative c-di-GMP-specific phosphodiesterase class I)
MSTSKPSAAPMSCPTSSLRAGDIGVVFQPIVDLVTGEAFAHEALARCKVPDYRNPVTLFDQAEKEKDCGRLGRLVRQIAVAKCPELPLFLNVHPQELNDYWLVRPDDPLAFHPQGVYLEVTESAAIDFFDLCVGVLREVRSRTGAKLAVDDLGAGYSNLKRIVDLEPDVVKLDIQLTRGVDKNPRQRFLIKQLVILCSGLGAKIVAEGIETNDELAALRDAGVQFGQGYLLAKPAYPAPCVNWPEAASETRIRIAEQWKPIGSVGLKKATTK